MFECNGEYQWHSLWFRFNGSRVWIGFDFVWFGVFLMQELWFHMPRHSILYFFLPTLLISWDPPRVVALFFCVGFFWESPIPTSGSWFWGTFTCLPIQDLVPVHRRPCPSENYLAVWGGTSDCIALPVLYILNFPSPQEKCMAVNWKKPWAKGLPKPWFNSGYSKIHHLKGTL